MELAQAVMACPLFKGIASGQLEAALSCLGTRQKHFASGERILRQGEKAGSTGIVLRGCVQIEETDVNGNTSIRASLGPGELFAETFALAGAAQMPISAVAEGASDVLLLDVKRLFSGTACPLRGTLTGNLLQILAAKNLALNDRLLCLTQRTTRQKLLFYLHRQAALQQSNSFTIPFDRQALADYLAVERSALSAEIGRMQREGLLHTRRSRFELLGEIAAGS